jgi:hypothetical protein
MSWRLVDGAPVTWNVHCNTDGCTMAVVSEARPALQYRRAA